MHLFNLFHLTEQIGFEYVRAQTIKLVQASTIASLFVVRNVGTITARRAEHVM